MPGDWQVSYFLAPSNCPQEVIVEAWKHTTCLFRTIVFLPPTSEGWEKVIFSLCVSVHTSTGGGAGVPSWRRIPLSQVRMGVPHPSWQGVPSSQVQIGVPPSQVRMGGTPSQVRMGGTPFPGQDGGTPSEVKTGCYPPSGLDGSPQLGLDGVPSPWLDGGTPLPESGDRETAQLRGGRYAPLRLRRRTFLLQN